MNKFQTIESWLSEALSDNEKGPCTALTCVHKVGSSDDEVYGIKCGDKQWNIKELAEIFMHKAQTRVQEEPGSHKFWIYAFYGSLQPENKYAFRVNSTSELGGDSTEEPTDRGHKAQSMRHGEASFQFAFKHSQELVRMTLELNRDLMKYNREITSENAEAIRLVKEVILEKATSNHEFRMKEIQFLNNASREESFMKFLPALANTITGKEVFPQGTQDTSIVEMLLTSLSEDQVKMLCGALPAEAQGIVAARATEFFKAKREAEELARRAAESQNVHNELGEEDEPKAAE